MVDEPLILTEDFYFQDACNANHGKTIMVIERDGVPEKMALNAWYIDPEDLDMPENLFGVFREFGSDKPFWINKYNKRNGLSADAEWVNGEEFIGYLMERYPDHLEWFLFHPEWLAVRDG